MPYYVCRRLIVCVLNCIIETVPVNECRVLASPGPGRGCQTFFFLMAYSRCRYSRLVREPQVENITVSGVRERRNYVLFMVYT